MSNLIPLADKVVLLRLDAQQTTPGGIHLPDSAKEKSIEGKVVAVGPGKLLDNGTRTQPLVSVGQHVLFRNFGGQEVSLNGTDYLVVAENDIFAIIEGE